jgi:hypothetical protein
VIIYKENWSPQLKGVEHLRAKTEINNK